MLKFNSQPVIEMPKNSPEEVSLPSLVKTQHEDPEPKKEDYRQLYKRNFTLMIDNKRVSEV
jgi:hypothetical protein